MKQTAVEWLYEHILLTPLDIRSINVLPLAVSGGFGTQNCQTKIKVKWNTKI